MSFRVTRANVKQLVEAMGEVTTAWENAEESIATWIEYQDTPPTDEDGRDARREAREAIESDIDALGGCARGRGKVPSRQRSALNIHPSLSAREGPRMGRLASQPDRSCVEP
jgi:hypothetical protein